MEGSGECLISMGRVDATRRYQAKDVSFSVELRTRARCFNSEVLWGGKLEKAHPRRACQGGAEEREERPSGGFGCPGGWQAGQVGLGQRERPVCTTGIEGRCEVKMGAFANGRPFEHAHSTGVVRRWPPCDGSPMDG